MAKEPTAPEGNQTYAGPGMAILHSARAAVASGSDVQFISIGFGVGSKTSVDYQKEGVYYPAFTKWAGQLKGKVTFAALIIMLGITERHLTSSEIPGFPDRIAKLVSDIRSDLGEPDLPVLFCDYEQLATGDLAPTGSVGKSSCRSSARSPTRSLSWCWCPPIISGCKTTITSTCRGTRIGASA